MNARLNAIRAGMQRGAIEMRNSLQTPTDIGYYLVGNIVFVVVMIFNRSVMIEGLGISVAQLAFPGVLAMIVVFVSTYGLATLVSTEREDGTLLRAKSLPHGMTGYVAGQTTRTTLELAFSAAILIIAGSILIPGLWTNGLLTLLEVIGLLLLGLLATLPLGIALGSLFKNPRALGGWGFFVFAGLILVSGLFMPLADLPWWGQLIGQVFPLYWLGLGMRSVLLPESTVVIELGESWRTLEMLGVLGAWAVVGLLLAPVLLRRMARRESGSAVEARRQSALQRTT